MNVRHPAYDVDYGGTTFVVPWSGEVIPLDPPAEPAPQPSPPIPFVNGPIPVIVHGVEYAWDDVRSWVSDAWHGLSSLWSSETSFAVHTVETMIDTALTIEQEAWASFISQLQAWITDGLYWAGNATIELAVTARRAEVWLYDTLTGAIDTLSLDVFRGIAGIEGQIVAQWWETVNAIDNAVAGVETWAIDRIADPIVVELGRVESTIDAKVLEGVAAAEDWARSYVDDRVALILADLGLLSGALTVVEAWVADCGVPMCEQMGPNTDWSKLLKLLNVGQMLALLTTFGLLTESDIQSLAVEVATTGGDAADRFVQLFVDAGDTLAQALADTLPALVP